MTRLRALIATGGVFTILAVIFGLMQGLFWAIETYSPSWAPAALVLVMLAGIIGGLYRYFRSW